MALTSINNLDGLDAVININAADEVLVKAGIREILHKSNDARLSLDLFLGQMQAEGFANVIAGAIRIVVESPTMRVNFIQTGANKTRVHAYLYIDSAWVLTSEVVMDWSLSADGT